jgi:hypothetical protein
VGSELTALRCSFATVIDAKKQRDKSYKKGLLLLWKQMVVNYANNRLRLNRYTESSAFRSRLFR